MIRVVMGEDPYDVKFYVGGRELNLADLRLSRVAFEITADSRPKLVLETEVFQADVMVREEDTTVPEGVF